MRAATDLLQNYQHLIESVTLTTGAKGIFDVTVDGEALYSKHAEGRHAREGEVLSRFVDRYAGDFMRYGE